jgi:hypothetical protein
MGQSGAMNLGNRDCGSFPRPAPILKTPSHAMIVIEQLTSLLRLPSEKSAPPTTARSIYLHLLMRLFG